MPRKEGKSIVMDDERLAREPATARCRYCGSHATETAPRPRRDLKAYQVIVVCASCNTALAAISRN